MLYVRLYLKELLFKPIFYYLGLDTSSILVWGTMIVLVLMRQQVLDELFQVFIEIHRTNSGLVQTTDMAVKTLLRSLLALEQSVLHALCFNLFLQPVRH